MRPLLAQPSKESEMARLRVGGYAEVLDRPPGTVFVKLIKRWVSDGVVGYATIHAKTGEHGTGPRHLLRPVLKSEIVWADKPRRTARKGK